MKKLFAICAATLMLAGIASSCSKVCECTVAYGGISTTSEVDLSGSGYKSCKAYNDVLQAQYAGISDNVTIDCKRK